MRIDPESRETIRGIALSAAVAFLAAVGIIAIFCGIGWLIYELITLFPAPAQN
ncbi:hypothetical protein [Nocardia sp. JMUB6875]|uniref:hypothetical protein n=1 Tax=Nocardia sp. JMUB6875 TaxID=3158170 RepID=UPI0034E88270